MADGFLEKLWDDVLAGPQPDKGLKKLRKKTMEQQQPSDDSALPDGMVLDTYWFCNSYVTIPSVFFSLLLSPSGQMQASADQNDSEASTLASLSICLGVLLDVRVDFDLRQPVGRN
jgi:hypothetical protein